jgi:PhzF family phenazine biosynthesis protein
MFIVPFKQVDVFTTHAFGGNPVAVVLDGEGLNATQMQHIAAWTNLSETAFVLNPTQAGASYRVRIFTPKSELPFAGHPSVGTAHALIEAGLAPHPERGLVQECAAGLLPISVREAEGRRCVSIRTPVARQEVPTGFDPALIDVALAGLTRGALPPQSWNNGPRWWLAEVANEAELRAHAPDFEAIAALCRASGATGLAAFAETGRAAGATRGARLVPGRWHPGRSGHGQRQRQHRCLAARAGPGCAGFLLHRQPGARTGSRRSHRSRPARGWRVDRRLVRHRHRRHDPLRRVEDATMTDLRDKIVWITGASGGIGEGLAQRAAARGAKLILSARREAELERVRQGLPRAAGCHAAAGGSHAPR